MNVSEIPVLITMLRMYKKFLIGVLFFSPSLCLAAWVPSPFVTGTLYQNTGTTTLFYNAIDLSVNDLLIIRVSSSSALTSSTNFDVTFLCEAASIAACSVTATVPPNNFYIIGGGTAAAAQQFQQSIPFISTTTINLGQIDNANEDYFFGMLLFLGTAWFIIWIFRGGRRA